METSWRRFDERFKIGLSKAQLFLNNFTYYAHFNSRENIGGLCLLHNSVFSLARVIEVKSSVQEPPRVIITRGEWESAVEFGEAYVFHIWKVGAVIPIEMNVASMMQNIPIDQGTGTWLEVEVVGRAE